MPFFSGAGELKTEDEIFPIFFINDQTMLSASTCSVCALSDVSFDCSHLKSQTCTDTLLGASRELTALKAAGEKEKKVGASL